MKKYYLAFVLFSVFAGAQTINFPDPNFRISILTYNIGIDTNSDGQIQMSEALAATTLNIEGGNVISLTGIANFTNLTNLRIHNTAVTNVNLTALTNLQHLQCDYNASLTTLNITNLTNLQHLDLVANRIGSLAVSNLTNLTYLDCRSNNLGSLDVTNLTGLTYLVCAQNHLTSLNVGNLVNLETLSIANNNIHSLNVSSLINLKNYGCDSNAMTAVDVSALVHLEGFTCGNNLLTSLDLSHNPALLNLQCQSNQLTQLNLDNQTQLLRVLCYDNLFTELDFSHTKVLTGTNLCYFYNNPLLERVNLKTGIPFSVNSSLYAYSCPNLLYLCADEYNVGFVQDEIAQFSPNNPNAQVNSYCSFLPGGLSNMVTGTLRYDADGNGCDASDPHLPKFIKVNMTTGTQSETLVSDNDGVYKFYTQLTNVQVLSPALENPSYFTVAPASASVSFVSIDGSTQVQDFCIAPLGVHHDAEVTIIPLNNARPGSDASYEIIYKNKGNQVLSGAIDMEFDDAVLDLVSASPLTSGQNPNHLMWNYSGLLPFESRKITVSLNLNSPQEIPAVNAGDVLHYTAAMSHGNDDETPADNIFPFNQTVRGSLDPNDKICVEGDLITVEKVGDYLHYVVHFQNTGTDEALQVVVKDLIDPTVLDISSLQLIDTSHPANMKITGSKTEFIFEDIHLAAMSVDEPASHGYVAFKIKTLNTLVAGNTVANTANIYFDYNFPVATNTATTTVALLGVNAFEDDSVKIAPNPVRIQLHFTANDKITSIQLFDMHGRLLETMTTTGIEADLNLAHRASGVYFVKIFTAKGMKVQKVVKE